MTAAVEAGFYPAALHIQEMFIDPTYQRVPTDVPRARKYAAAWDPRLVGILEVSDRGESASPRYAVIDGQHRWAAMGFRANPRPLVANVHVGLTVAEEAALFDKLNRERKQTGTWDHWKARRAAGDAQVVAIEAVVGKVGLRVSDTTASSGAVSCIGTLEKVAACAGGLDLLQVTLDLLTDAYGTNQRSAFEAPLIHGMAMAVSVFGDRIEAQRLIDALGEQSPKRVRVQATTMRDSGIPGSLAKLSAVAVVNVYNSTPGKRLTWPSDWRGVLPKPVREKVTAAAQAKYSRSHMQSPALEQVGEPKSVPRKVPTGLPPAHPETDEYADAVADMEGKSVAEIADSLGIPERSVRRIQADLGMGVV